MATTFECALSLVDVLKQNEDSCSDALLLEALLLCAPSADGQALVATHIIESLSSDKGVVASAKDLAKWWHGSLLVPMTACGGKTPRPTLHPSRGIDNEVASEIERSRRSEQSLIKQQALKRDGYRCRITGFYDDSVWESEPDRIENDPDAACQLTNASHIIPWSYNDFVDGTSSEKVRVNAWSALKCFSGWEGLIGELRGDLINRLDNIITMTVDVHGRFGPMKGWLEAIESEENQYIWHVRNTQRDRVVGVRDRNRVDLTPDPMYADIPAPNRRFLMIHSSVAKVLRISGRGEMMEKIWRDYKDIKVLAEDGSDAAVLENALWLTVSKIPYKPNNGEVQRSREMTWSVLNVNGVTEEMDGNWIRSQRRSLSSDQAILESNEPSPRDTLSTHMGILSLTTISPWISVVTIPKDEKTARLTINADDHNPWRSPQRRCSAAPGEQRALEEAAKRQKRMKAMGSWTETHGSTIHKLKATVV